MRRGRKKDLTIPPTRALVQQRDYRARKANYIAELEERVRKAEEENIQLRKDLEMARAGLGVPAMLLNSKALETSRELMQHLSLAASSLARFQQAVFPEGQQPLVLPSTLPGTVTQSNTTSLTPSIPFSGFAEVTTRFPNQAEKANIVRPLSSVPLPLATSHPLPDPLRPHLHGSSDKPSLDHSRLSPTSESSECCGGILDCQGLVEEEVDDNHSQAPLVPERLSEMRSTAERPFYI